MTLTIGIDIGGTKIAAGVVTEDGTIVADTRRPTPVRDADAVVATIIDLVAELRQDRQIEAIGVGVAGLVDSDRARVMFAPNLGWVEQPLRAEIEHGTNLPTVVENDANVAAWGEYRHGAGRGHDDVTVITVGTGIGGGIVLGGNLIRGAHGAAAEIGHLQLVPDGRPCACGRRGCWEQYASGNALVREARLLAAERRPDAKLMLSLGDGTPEGVQGRHVTDAARKGDPVALEAFQRAGTALGEGLTDLVALLDPASFVLGGGVAEAGDLLLVPARTVLARDVIGGVHRPVPELRIAELGNLAGLIGAADLARTR
ncbi:MAG: ROK family glucokinase [Actinomycetota bacterium]|nr:MAG: ROK family glucokinase [Actinomycetota bacterium]